MDLPDPIYSFRGKMDRILSLLHLVESDKELLYVGTQGGLVHVWDLKFKREVNEVEVGQAPCTSIIEVPQGCVTLTRDESVKIWDTRWNLLLTIPVDYCGFSGVASCGSDLLIPARDGKIKIVTMSGEPVWEFSPSTDEKLGELMCLQYLESRDVIVAGYESKVIVTLKKTGETVRKVSLKDEPICLGLCKISSEIIVGTSGNFVTKLAFEKDCPMEVCATQLTNPGISAISMRSDSKLCVAACWDKKVRYFSTKKLKLLAALDFSVASDCVLFGSAKSMEPGLVYVGDGDGRVTIWNLYADKM